MVESDRFFNESGADEENFDSEVNISQESTVGIRTELMVANSCRMIDVISAKLDVNPAPLSVCETFPTADSSKPAKLLAEDDDTKRNAVVTRADVLCEVEKSPDGNEHRSGCWTSKVDHPTDDFAVDSTDEKVAAYPSWNSTAVSSHGKEGATIISLFPADSKDESMNCADRHLPYIEDLFTKRKLSSEEEEEEEKQQLVDVIQVRLDSAAGPPDVDDVEATAAKQLAIVTNSECAEATDEEASAAIERVNGGEVAGDDRETALLKADSVWTAESEPSERRCESDKAMQLSSMDVSPIAKIFDWLDYQSWALEYHPDDVDNAVCIGITAISESEARQRLDDAGFAVCGVQFRIFASPLTGAVFTRCLRVGPGIGVLGGVGQIPGTRNRALLGGAVGGSDDASAGRRFCLTVAHLFNQVGDECSTVSGQALGHCVVRELDNVQVVSLGPVFADVSIVQLVNDVVVDNSLQIVADSNYVQPTFSQVHVAEPAVGADVCLLTQCGEWRRGQIELARSTVKVFEGDQLKLLPNVVRIHRDRRAINDEGDSGTLVYSAAGDPTFREAGVPSRPVYGMAVGKVDLENGTSFTVANRLCDVLPAIHGDRRNAELFRGYKELTLCGTAAGATQRDSGFNSL